MPLPGQFILHNNVLPALQAGTHTVRSKQTITAPGATPEQRDTFVEVTAPRYLLPPDQVLSTFPPNKASGAFSTRLPQIVLRRRTLPWERRAAQNLGPEVPWLALVLLADGEGEFKSGLPIAACVTSGVQMYIPLRNDATVGDALTVDNRVLHRTFPAMDELAVLAHVRRVDLNDTELALGDDDGWLAVIVCNRLPQPNTSYTAYLISVENQIGNLGLSGWYQDHDRATAPPTEYPIEPKTTYPVLAHWSFTCTGSGDFQSLMQGLDVGMIGTLPAPAAPSGDKPPPPARPRPPVVAETGHIALDYVNRDGEPDLAWYRGPLVPAPGTRDTVDANGKLPLLHTSDQARRIGPDGRENLALATAFEIGRLLALAEPSVVAALLLWRKEGLDAARSAALIAAEPALAALRTDDVGSGFAARAGLALLTALGADDAGRLGATVDLGVPPPPLAGDVLVGAATVATGLQELSDRADDEFDALRSAVLQAAAQLAEETNGGEG
jgi:hypothetical protein